MRRCLPILLLLCAPLVVCAQSTPNAGLAWWRLEGWGDYRALWSEQQQRYIGAWHVYEHHYRTIAPDGSWSNERSAEPPIPPPPEPPPAGPRVKVCAPGCPCGKCGGPDGKGCDCGHGGICKVGCVIDSDGKANFGVDRKEISQAPRYWLDGKIVDRKRALEAIGDPGLVDDSRKLRLTIIGPEAERKQVLQDLAASPALAAWKDKVIVSEYDPGHWHVAKSGFVTGGHPTIYYQAPSGEVLHRQDDYAGGAAALATALRKADPSYSPANDPDKRKDDGGLDLSGIDLSQVPTWAWVLAAVALVLLLQRRES